MANLHISEFPCTYRQNSSPSSAECPELRLIKWNYPEFPECLMKKKKPGEDLHVWESEKCGGRLLPAVRKSCLMTFQSHWAQEVNNTLKLKYAVQWLCSYKQLMLLHGTGVRFQHPCNAAHSCLQLLLQGILPPLRTHAQCAYAQVFAHMHACAHTHAHTLKKY